MHVAVVLLTALLGGFIAPAARAHVEMTATLDTAQEVPEPAGTLAGAGGTATFVVLEENNTIQYDIQYQNLSGAPIAAHIHTGARCVAGGIAVGLTLPAGAGASGAISGTTAQLSPAQLEAVLAGGAYVNFHTATNQGGEIRGQMGFAPGRCPCDRSVKKCVKGQVRQLEKAERKAQGIKDLLKRTKKSACGKTKGAKKAVGCCLPIAPEEGILTEPVCALVTAKACGKLGGTPTGGTTCGPTNPCVVPATACR
jgi:hypothetical protein